MSLFGRSGTLGRTGRLRAAHCTASALLSSRSRTCTLTQSRRRRTSDSRASWRERDRGHGRMRRAPPLPSCGGLDPVESSLLIDQRSASLAACQQDVKTWAAGRRVFVSSLITDMPAERSAVRAAVEDLAAVAVMFEDLGAQDISAEQPYLSGVRSSDVYVGMWGRRYGVRMPDGCSATHVEFIEAERNGLRLCLFVHAGTSGEMDGPQRDLVASARNLYTTSSRTDPDDLGRRVRRRLEEVAADELAPWVRVGRAVFRAREITNDGSTISIVALVRINAVHAELVWLRDQRAGGVQFASTIDARTVQLVELATRTVSTVGP